jgi:hypothetical protein
LYWIALCAARFRRSRVGNHAEATRRSELERQPEAPKLRRPGNGVQTEHWTSFTVGSAFERVQICREGSELAAAQTARLAFINQNRKGTWIGLSRSDSRFANRHRLAINAEMV